MKTHLVVLILLYGLMAEVPAKYKCMKSVEKNGMKVSWKFQDDKIDFEISAPTKGWLAIGFNETTDLKGTNLIMAAVENGEVKISDRYIVGFGDHRDVETLGGTNHLSAISGVENASGSQIEFSIAINPKDNFHHQLRSKQTIPLLIAYSHEDDFLHHSTMRSSVRITL